MPDNTPKKPRLNLRTTPYGGKKANLLNAYHRRLENTRKVEGYLNSIMTEASQMKTVFDIAEATHLLERDVREVLEANGENNGITF